MNEPLPRGWARTTLGNVCSVEYGKGLPKRQRVETGSVGVYGSAGLVGRHDRALVDKPVVIVGRKGNAGAVWHSEEPSWPIDTTYFLRVPSGICTEYLGMQLGSLNLVNQDSSTTIPSLRRPDLEAVSIALAPTAEQERIGAAIEEHFLRIDVVQTALSASRTRLDALQRSAAATLFDRPGWTWTTLGEIAALKGGITKDSKREADPDFVEYPYLRVANVQRGFLDLTEVTAVRADPYKAANLVLLPGDMLFNEGGDRDKLGRGWVWEGQIENCIHQNHVFRARLTDDRFDPYFISLHANTWGQRWFDTHGKQTTNLASISLATLKSFPVPAPPPDEQRAVVDELQSIMRSEDRLRADLDRVERRSKTLRRAVLSRAFSGQLVPQDPNDEPVSVLMERIAAHRAAERAYGGLRRSRAIPDKLVSPE